jgi:outer membrane biosynthesis protein TonB
MALPSVENNAFETYLAKPLGDKHIRLNISRNTLIAVLISIVLHGLLLSFVVPKIDIEPAAPVTTIEVSLAPKAAPPQPLPPELPPQTELPKPAPKVIAQKPTRKPSQSKKPDLKVPEVLTKPEPSPQTSPPPATPPNTNNAPKDMSEYIAQQRAKREAAEADAASQNAAAVLAERGPSESEKRDARIKNNLKVGTNGIFEIRRLETNSASFSFRGWTDNQSNAKLEYFEVEAKSGEDVRLAMIRRMIAIIRKHYQGDFDWESHRLGRTVIKSARVEDSEELEDFLMQEFFGRYYKTQSN